LDLERVSGWDTTTSPHEHISFLLFFLFYFKVEKEKEEKGNVAHEVSPSSSLLGRWRW